LDTLGDLVRSLLPWVDPTRTEILGDTGLASDEASALDQETRLPSITPSLADLRRDLPATVVAPAVNNLVIRPAVESRVVNSGDARLGRSM